MRCVWYLGHIKRKSTVSHYYKMAASVGYPAEVFLLFYYSKRHYFSFYK